jgi:hypothetical protein
VRQQLLFLQQGSVASSQLQQMLRPASIVTRCLIMAVYTCQCAEEPPASLQTLSYVFHSKDTYAASVCCDCTCTASIPAEQQLLSKVLCLTPEGRARAACTALSTVPAEQACAVLCCLCRCPHGCYQLAGDAVPTDQGYRVQESRQSELMLPLTQLHLDAVTLVLQVRSQFVRC